MLASRSLAFTCRKGNLRFTMASSRVTAAENATQGSFRRAIFSTYGSADNAFRSFDRRKRGWLSRQDFKIGCSTLNVHLSDIQRKAIRKEMDPYKTARVKEQDFLAFVVVEKPRKKKKQQIFMSYSRGPLTSPFASWLTDKLRDAGFSCWMDSKGISNELIQCTQTQ